MSKTSSSSVVTSTNPHPPSGETSFHTPCLRENELKGDVEGLFAEVLHRLGHPGIRGIRIIGRDDPCWAEIGVMASAFDQVRREVRIFVGDLDRYLLEPGGGLAPMKGLIAHEIGHGMYFTADPATNLYIQYKARKLFGEECGSLIRFAYADFQDNNCLLRDGRVTEWLKAYSLLGIAAWGDRLSSFQFLDRLYYVLLLGLPLDTGLARIPRRIRRKYVKAALKLLAFPVAPAGDVVLHGFLIEQFGKILLPFLEHPSSAMAGGEGEDQSDGLERKNSISPESSVGKAGEETGHADPDPGSHEIASGDIRSLIKFLPLQEYLELKNMISPVLNTSLPRLEAPAGGQPGVNTPAGPADAVAAGSLPTVQKIRGIGTEKGIAGTNPGIIDYYLEAAEEYGVVYRPWPAKADTSVKEEVFSRDFSLTDPVESIDSRFSGGLILPGLTKLRAHFKEIIPAGRKTIPLPLLLYKDVSGSMPDPGIDKCPATIAGTILVESYLRSGVPVGVGQMNDSLIPFRTGTDRRELMAILCGPSGGGTRIDPALLSKDIDRFFKDDKVRSYDHGPCAADFVLITDGGINEVEKFLAYLKTEERIRPLILHDGTFNIPLKDYDQKRSGIYEGIMVISVQEPDDLIPAVRFLAAERLRAE